MQSLLTLLRRFRSRSLQRYRHMRAPHPLKALLKFIRHSFHDKKIVIISDKRIVSIPIPSHIQGGVMAIICAFMFWVSYASGKYFAFESILSAKEHEIWTTNLNNEELQQQVTSLHQNLSELNKYFDNIRRFDQSSKNYASGAPNGGREASRILAESEPVSKDEAVGKVLLEIRQKIVERITILEGLISMTGLQLDEIAANNGDLKRALLEYRKHQNTPEKKSSNDPMGGPFIPADGKNAKAKKNNHTIVDEYASLDREDFERKISYLLKLEQMIHVLPLAGPMERYYISSGFGRRMDPYRKVLALHAGTDLVGTYRAKVYSPAPGIVSYAHTNGAYGRMIEIDHGQAISTRYGHLDKVFVSPGDKVERGQLIGLQGNSGRSTGSHLHYEVRYNDEPLDPEHFLKAGRYVF